MDWVLSDAVYHVCGGKETKKDVMVFIDTLELRLRAWESASRPGRAQASDLHAAAPAYRCPR
jgi:hypothetical protein